MLNQSRKNDSYMLLARQIGHLTRAGHSYESAVSTLREAVDGELGDELEALQQLVEDGGQSADRRFASPVPMLAALSAAVRRRGLNPAAVFQNAEEVFGALGESYRAYWSGIGAFLGYAIALTVVVALVLGVFSIFVFPQIENIFAGNEQSLPAMTAATMEILAATRGLLFSLVAAAVIAVAIAAHRIRDAMKRLHPLSRVVTSIPGLRALGRGYNSALYLNLARLLSQSGLAPEEALEESARLLKMRGGAVPSEGMTVDAALGRDPVAGALALARRTGTLGPELDHLSAQAEAIFADRLAKVREEFTLAAQVAIGIVIAALVVSMYLPIFRMGTLF